MPTKISRRDLIVQVQGLTDCVEGAILPAIGQGLTRDRELKARIEVLDAFMQANLLTRLVWLVRGFRKRNEEQVPWT